METRDKIDQLRLLGRRYLTYPRGPRRSVNIERIKKLLDSNPDDDNDTTWTELAREVLADISPTDYCQDGKREVAKAKMLVGLPVVLHQATAKVYLGDITLPSGQTAARESNYLVTVTDKEGNTIITQQMPIRIFSAEYPDDDDDDDDYDYDDDDDDDEDEEDED